MTETIATGDTKAAFAAIGAAVTKAAAETAEKMAAFSAAFSAGLQTGKIDGMEWQPEGNEPLRSHP